MALYLQPYRNKLTFPVSTTEVMLTFPIIPFPSLSLTTISSYGLFGKFSLEMSLAKKIMHITESKKEQHD